MFRNIMLLVERRKLNLDRFSFYAQILCVGITRIHIQNCLFLTVKRFIFIWLMRIRLERVWLKTLKTPYSPSFFCLGKKTLKNILLRLNGPKKTLFSLETRFCLFILKKGLPKWLKYFWNITHFKCKCNGLQQLIEQESGMILFLPTSKKILG